MKLNPECCRKCGKYTRQVCESRDGKCEKFIRWFVAEKLWSQVVERLRRRAL